MEEYGGSLTFAGVSATPNIATRLYDRLCDGYRWLVAAVAIGGFEGWFAEADPFEFAMLTSDDRDIR